MLGAVLRFEGLGDVPDCAREDLKALCEGAGATVLSGSAAAVKKRVAS